MSKIGEKIVRRFKDFVERAEENRELPTLHEVRRLGRWDTNGMTSVEFVRHIRNTSEPT